MVNNGQFSLENYGFTKMIIGCILVGIGFGVPSVVYNKDNMPMPIKMLIHMGIGCIVYTIVAYSVGWAGNSDSFLQCIIMIVIQLAIAFVIWFCFMIYYRQEAKLMNAKIQEVNDKWRE